METAECGGTEKRSKKKKKMRRGKVPNLLVTPVQTSEAEVRGRSICN